MASILHSLKEIVSFIAAIFMIITFSLILFSLGYSVPYLSQHIGDPHFAVPFYLAIPIPIVLFFVEGQMAYIWYILLTSVAILASFYCGYKGIYPYFKEFFSKPFSYKHNLFQDVTELFSLSLFFTMLIYYLSLLFGYTPSTIGIEKYPLWYQMLQTLHAAVYEEIIVRFLFLGLPLFLTYRLLGKKLPYYRIFGGGFKLGTFEIIYLLISSLIFGFAHMSSWGPWKVIPAFVAGLALGYLYLRYGILASIVLHFINDFISAPLGISNALLLPFSIVTIYFMVAGAVFFISYSIRIYHHFHPQPKKEKMEIERPPWPSSSQKNVDRWIDLRCPICGGDVFQYVDENHLKCLRCGNIIELSSYREQSHQSEREGHLL